MYSSIRIYRNEFHIYYHYKKTLRLKTGVKVQKGEVNSIQKRLKSNGFPNQYKEYQGAILSIQRKVDNIISDYEIHKGRKPSPNEIQLKLEQGETSESLVYYAKRLVDRKAERYSDPIFSKESLKDYKSFLNSLIDFETENDKPIYISNLSVFIPRYFIFLRKERVNTSTKKYITRGALMGKTIRKRLDSLCELIKDLSTKEGLDIDSLYLTNQVNEEYDRIKRKLKQKTVKYALDKEGMEALRNLMYNNESRSPLSRFALDIFCFACLTGMRFSDVIKVSKKDLQLNPKRIEMTASKSSIEFTTPISDEAEEILKKYDYKLDRHSNGVLNRALKDELSKSEYFSKEIKIKKEKYVRYETISFHTARRTFISRLLNEFNISPARVMKMSGHTQISTLSEYIVPDDQLFDTNRL